MLASKGDDDAAAGNDRAEVAEEHQCERARDEIDAGDVDGVEQRPGPQQKADQGPAPDSPQARQKRRHGHEQVGGITAA